MKGCPVTSTAVMYPDSSVSATSIESSSTRSSTTPYDSLAVYLPSAYGPLVGVGAAVGDAEAVPDAVV